jgi:hypothetical protein
MAKAKTADKTAQADGDVAAFMRTLEHPLKKEIAAARAAILGVSPTIGEGIKWNAPSFRPSDYFATVNLRSHDTLQLIFHTGAKAKNISMKGAGIPDPDGLVKWLADDRCMITLGRGKAFEGHRAAFEAIVRTWIGQMA